jgi:hypothetical protein
MVRFVGNGLHPTDFARIDAWASRLANWCAHGLRQVYFFTHEPDNLLAPDLAAYAAAAMIKQMPHAILRGPERVQVIPKQGSLF